jgi:putative colanic acid biosynthesis glycosyltransferase
MDLHMRHLRAGGESQLLYGYGKGAKPSAQAEETANVQHVSRRWSVGLNFLAHRTFGVDVFGPTGRGLALLRSAIEAADVVHLHAVHSHFVNFERLFDLLLAAERAVVWTLHDSWAMTGRCALPGGCRRFQHGCGSCPLPEAYPRAALDLTKQQWKIKQGWLEDLAPQLTFVGCSDWMTGVARERFPGHRVVFVPNGTDMAFEQARRSGQMAGAGDALLIVGADLSDPAKWPRADLTRCLASWGGRVRMVGANPPVLDGSYEYGGLVDSRAAMVKEMVEAQALLFLSQVDNYPLVLMEALSVGTPVLALRSAAANEVLGRLGVQPANDLAELVDVLRSGAVWRLYPPHLRDRATLARHASDAFSGAQTHAQYTDLYREVLG